MGLGLNNKMQGKSQMSQFAGQIDTAGINLADLRALMEHPKIQEMLSAPLPSENMKPVPSRPELQMLPPELIKHKPSLLDSQEDPAVVLSYEATVIREELIGYVDAIL
jgi:hypothetical protein